MEQNEIMEGNELIAVFDGLVKGKGEYHNGMVDKNGQSTYDCWHDPLGRHSDARTDITHLKYHSSWDWLMPVVEKINSGNEYDVIIYRTTCHINDKIELLIETTSKGKLIECVWQAVVEFIKYYNSQPSKQPLP